MRLLYVTAAFPFGPGEAFFEEETAEFTRQGWQLLIVPRSPRGKARGTSLKHGYDVSGEPVISGDILRTAAGVLIGESKQVRAAVLPLLREGAHIAKNMSVIPKALWLAQVAREWKADHIHAQWASTTATMAMIASAVSGVPWSFTAHRWDILDANLLEEKARRASFVRAISRDGLDLLSRRVRPADHWKIEVVHLGVTIPDVALQQRVERRASNHITLMCAGALIQRKGHTYLLRALALLKQRGLTDISLLLAGDGPLREALEREAQSLGIGDQVDFLGNLAHDDLLAQYASGRVDLAVLPSLHEGIPVVLIEALSYGVPVVATAVGGTPELCRPDCAVVVPPVDAEALAAAIQSLAADRPRMLKMGDAGRRRVAREFSVDSTVRTLGQLISQSG